MGLINLLEKLGLKTVPISEIEEKQGNTKIKPEGLFGLNFIAQTPEEIEKMNEQREEIQNIGLPEYKGSESPFTTNISGIKNDIKEITGIDKIENKIVETAKNNIINPILNTIGLNDIDTIREETQRKIAEDKGLIDQEQEKNQEIANEELEKQEEQANADKELEIKYNEDIKTIMEYLDKYQSHLEEREDTAYQRAVEDMRKAGINPNLIGNINPANSTDIRATTLGNAITSSQNTKAQIISQQLINQINNATNIDNKNKDIINSLIRTAIILLMK